MKKLGACNTFTFCVLCFMFLIPQRILCQKRHQIKRKDTKLKITIYTIFPTFAPHLVALRPFKIYKNLILKSF